MFWWCSSLRTLKSWSKTRQSFKTFKTKSRSTIKEGILDLSDICPLWWCVGVGGLVMIRVWGHGPARPRRLSVVTGTRGRSHPRTGHTGVTVVVTGIHVNSDTYVTSLELMVSMSESLEIIVMEAVVRELWWLCRCWGIHDVCVVQAWSSNTNRILIFNQYRKKIYAFIQYIGICHFHQVKLVSGLNIENKSLHQNFFHSAL